jgi:hypothetical protein
MSEVMSKVDSRAAAFQSSRLGRPLASEARLPVDSGLPVMHPCSRGVAFDRAPFNDIRRRRSPIRWLTALHCQGLRVNPEHPPLVKLVAALRLGMTIKPANLPRFLFLPEQ